jgi:hypothetical protein
MELPGNFLSAKTGRSKVFDERQITTHSGPTVFKFQERLSAQTGI